jgi:O-acetyl-ADP-ribose deacetylase (regulator of RNase III)
LIIKVVKGNLLDLFDNREFDAIVHGCNCFNNMGAGIAKQIKERYPSAYVEDCKTKKGDKHKLGDYTYTTLVDDFLPGYLQGSNQRYVINAYTQYDYKGHKPVDYEAIRKVFTLINRDFEGFKIGIPKIGAGLAGGDWDKIKRIIDSVTPNLDITLVEYGGK